VPAIVRCSRKTLDRHEGIPAAEPSKPANDNQPVVREGDDYKRLKTAIARRLHGE
jgi:hypothetical protein